ncbi:MAG: hypothetical protein ABFQ65_01610 [Nanoarchaeota archaeon]
MENIEKIAKEVSREVVKERAVEIKPMDYQGLKLLESAKYDGGTSIKYWM